MVWRKLRFPNMAVTLMKRETNSRYHPNDVVFKVDPKFTKHDIKEYLTKIYGLNVQKVNTMNYEGKSLFNLSLVPSPY